MLSFVALAATILVFSDPTEARWFQWKSVSKSCSNPSTTHLSVPGGHKLLTLHARGNRIFWCNNSTFEYTHKGKLHGDTQANLTTADNLWKGQHFYRPDNGRPAWVLYNQVTGQKISVVGEQRPQVRTRPGNATLSWDRRKVIASYGAKVDYVIRTRTSTAPLPAGCFGDIDAIVPMTAVYTFISCKGS